MNKLNFNTEHAILIKAILTYLGVTLESPGYQPVGDSDERLRKAFASNYESIQDDIKKIIDVTMEIEVDWKEYPWPDKASMYIEEQLEIMEVV